MGNPFSIFIFFAGVAAYPAIIWLFIRLYQRGASKKLFYIALGVFIAGYAAVYIPSIEKQLEFTKWRSQTPDFQTFVSIDPGGRSGVYIPHLTCTQLCKDLLIRAEFEFVETKADFVQSATGRFLAREGFYARWVVRRSERFCNGLSDEVLARPNIHPNRILLAQGICFVPVFIDAPKAPLQITQTFEKTLSDGAGYTKAEAKTFEGFVVENGSRKPAFVAKFRSVTRTAFPLLLSAKPGRTFIPKELQDGVATLEEVFERLGVLDRSESASP